MKNLKKVLALVLAIVMIMSVVTVASAKDYTDVKATDDYADAIDALSSLNILDGFKDGDSYSFKADGTFSMSFLNWRLPDLQIVPRLFSISSLSMPIPLSLTVSVRLGSSTFS